MKKCFLIFSLLLLTSCFSQEKTLKQEQANSGEILVNTGENIEKTNSGEKIIIPENEETTKVEEEFSQDLNELFNLIDEDSNAK